MKKLKIVNKELDKEFRKIRKSNSDDYSIILQQQEMLVDYYTKNKDDIEIEAWLEKYKILTYDFPNIIQIIISFFIGFVSSFALEPLSQYVPELFNGKEKDSLYLLISYFIFVITAVIIGIGIVQIVKKIVKDLCNTQSYYLNPFHAKVIEKILADKKFFIDNDKQYKKIKKMSKGK